MGVLSQHRESRTVWLGAAAAAADEDERRNPQQRNAVAGALRTAGRIPGAGALAAPPDSTWPNVQVALPSSGATSARVGGEGGSLIPRTTRLEHATSHGAMVMAHAPLSVVGSSKPTQQERPASGAMRAMHRMIDHLEARKAVLTKIFRDYDKDGSGSIDRDELSAGLRALGLRLSREEVDGVMAYLDTDGGGDIDLEEFLEHFKQIRVERGFAARLTEEKKSAAAAARAPPAAHRPSTTSRKAMARMIDHLVERKAVLTKMFREFDKDGSGTIDKEELNGALTALGLRFNADEIQGVMDYLDSDGGGDIDLQEFIEHFKIERAKRFDGHIPELKEAKLQLMQRLQQGQHVMVKSDGKRSCSPEGGAHHGLYRLLTAVERLQSLENLSTEQASSIRTYIQGLLQRGIHNATPDELEVLQHLHRVHAPYVSQGPYLRNGMGTKGPRFGEGQTQKRLVRSQSIVYL